MNKEADDTYNLIYDPSYGISSINAAHTHTINAGTRIGVTSPSAESITRRLDLIEERLAILQPCFELHEKFPALKQAYDEYKLIERLIGDGK
jgi:hypothetical protein